VKKNKSMKVNTSKAIKIAILFTVAAILFAQLIGDFVAVIQRRHDRATAVSRWPMDIFVGNSNGHGLSFTLRNTYGATLYHNASYRMYRQGENTWELVHTGVGENLRSIGPNIIQEDMVQWGNRKPAGQYRLAREFYLTQNTAVSHILKWNPLRLK